MKKIIAILFLLTGGLEALVIVNDSRVPMKVGLKLWTPEEESVFNATIRPRHSVKAGGLSLKMSFSSEAWIQGRIQGDYFVTPTMAREGYSEHFNTVYGENDRLILSVSRDSKITSSIEPMSFTLAEQSASRVALGLILHPDRRLRGKTGAPSWAYAVTSGFYGDSYYATRSIIPDRIMIFIEKLLAVDAKSRGMVETWLEAAKDPTVGDRLSSAKSFAETVLDLGQDYQELDRLFE